MGFSIMSRGQYYLWTGVLTVAFVAEGCGPSVGRSEVAQPVDVASTTAPATANAPPVVEIPSAAAGPPAIASKRFTPPFPERLDPFAPPKRAQGTVRRENEFGESVELKGFINVSGPRVVLSIDGVIAPIPEGGEKYGVQVISIDPPSAVLKRGSASWTATLE
jgi:hypothetical protein